MANRIQITIDARDNASAALSGLSKNLNKSSESASAFSSSLSRIRDIALGVYLPQAAVRVANFGMEAVRASYDQVKAVEEARFGLMAYEKDASKVEAVLSSLVAYARSDMGVLFNRKDMFAAASTLKMYGNETETLTDRVKILSKGVSQGKTTFQELSGIVGRAAAKGRLDAVDFDMLIERGIGLDKSFRGAAVTAEELWKALNDALPDKLLQARAETIEGRMIRLQTAFRDVGNAVLGVDKDTNQFIKGGLGDRFMTGVQDATKSLREFASNVGPMVSKAMGLMDAAGQKLGPAFRDLASAVTGSLVPGFQAAVRSDFVKMLGGALVTAAGAAIRVVEGVARVVGSFLSTLNGASAMLIGVVAGVVAYSAAMVVTRGALIAAAAAQGALNAVMNLNPFVLVASLVIGLVTAYIALTGTTDGAKSASERLDTAQDNLKVSTDALKFAQDSLRGALLGQEGAALAVEQATARYNEVLKNNAADSLPARQAAYDLKQAEENLARANQEVTTKTDEKKRKEQEAADAKQAVIDAEKAKAREIYGTRDAVDSQRGSVDMLKSSLSLLNGQKFSYSIEEIKSSHVPTPMKNAGYQPPKKALGSIYAPGGRTLVGEHGPELVDLPRGSQVTQAYRTRSEMMSGGDNVTIHISGDIYNQTPEAANAFWDRVDKASRLSRFGMAGGVAA